MPRVLVVDDDKVGRATLTEILQLEGFEVEEAEGGKAVIQRLGESDYDVMLLDLKMPDLDGLAVLEASSRLSPETQVIVFTAHGSLDSAIQAVRHGAHDYLLKPASCEDLLAAYSGDVVHPFQLMLSTCSNACRPLVPTHVVHCSPL